MDILLKDADYIITMDKNKRVLTHNSVCIKDNKIHEIGENTKCKANIIINAAGKVIYPGFINTHHHYYQSLTRNFPETANLKLFDWLLYLYEIWAHIDEDDIYTATRVAASELLLSGVTTSVDHAYIFPQHRGMSFFEAEVEALKTIGIRSVLMRGSMSKCRDTGGLPPCNIVQKEEEILRDSADVIDKYHDPEDFAMMQVGIAPCSPFSVTKNLMMESAVLARQKKLLLHTHLAETSDETNYCIQHYGKRPLALMEEVGWLGKNVFFAHGIHFNDKELKILQETGTGISHCPNSNMRLGSGVARIPEMLKIGVKVSLGVDGSASNDSSNFLQEIRNALLLARVHWGVSSFTPYNAIELATKGGASVIGRNELGSIEVGKAADIAMFSLKDISFAGGVHDPYGFFTMLGSNNRADTVIVNGKVVVESGHIKGIDEEKLIAQANSLSSKLRNG